MKYIKFVIMLCLLMYLFNMVLTCEEGRKIKGETAREIETLEGLQREVTAYIPHPTKVDKKSEKVKRFIEEKFPDSPMIRLIDQAFLRLPEDKAIRLFALAYTESGFGTNGYIAVECNNFWGYLYEGTSMRGCYSPRWDSPESAMDRFITLEENNWLATDNHDGYCVTGCESWQDNYDYFTLSVN